MYFIQYVFHMLKIFLMHKRRKYCE